LSHSSGIKKNLPVTGELFLLITILKEN